MSEDLGRPSMMASSLLLRYVARPQGDSAHEGGGGDEAADKRVVAGVHRVLDGIRQDEKQDEIERCN